MDSAYKNDKLLQTSISLKLLVECAYKLTQSIDNMSTSIDNMKTSVDSLKNKLGDIDTRLTYIQDDLTRIDSNFANTIQLWNDQSGIRVWLSNEGAW